MLSIDFKRVLLLITLLVFSACSERTIVLQPEDSRPPKRVVRPTRPVAPPIKEEILIKKNPNLGNRIDAPVKRPSVGSSSNKDPKKDPKKDSSTVAREAPSSNNIMERMSFPVGEYKSLRKRGRSTVRGRVYVENTNTSEKIPGKKVKLWLNPVTSYSRQWYQEDYLGGYKLSKIDKRIFNYMKLEYSDMNGNYTFSGVPTGEYYLVGIVKCTKACGLSNNRTIRLVKPIYVGSGTTKVDLSKFVP